MSETVIPGSWMKGGREEGLARHYRIDRKREGRREETEAKIPAKPHRLYLASCPSSWLIVSLDSLLGLTMLGVTVTKTEIIKEYRVANYQVAKDEQENLIREYLQFCFG